MTRPKNPMLFGSSIAVILMAIVAALIAAQWKQEALPAAALLAIFALTILKARLIVLDFIGLRGTSPVLSKALIAWPVLFAAAALGKAAFFGSLAFGG